jgi:ATP-dependent DNA helicase Rep
MAGPILVLAGPGTGKTYQLARRIQTLVDAHEVNPEEITVVTFTREAAHGMRGKLSDRGKDEYVELDKRPKNILTMHALGHRIINENASEIGLVPDVAVVTDHLLKEALIRDAALLAGLNEAAGKQALQDKARAITSPSDETKLVLARYSEILRACNAIDHDDQIATACDILDKHADVLEAYRAVARHLLVDEYQDINADQHRLIKLLTGGQEAGLFAVGDDDQSIYGFRGGDPRYIRSLHTDYPGSQILQLQVSRRCLKNILDCALTVVGTYDSARVAKVAPGYTAAEPGLVKVWNCPSDEREAQLIAGTVYAKGAAGEASDFFVLVPTRNYVKTISNALTAKGVSHDIDTATESSREWDTLRTLKRWLEHRSNLPTRHAIELVLSAGTTSMPGQKVKKPEKLAARETFARDIAELWAPVLTSSKPLDESFREAAGTKPTVEEVWKLLDSAQQAHQADLMPDFVEAIGRAFKIFPTIESFYRCLKFLEDTPSASGAAKSAVRILTFQSSKGLEADCVFIIGLEEGTLPKDLTDATSTAEEARLVFVAMTRAKKELHLTHARKRTGASTYKPVSHQLNASAFVGCFPKGQSEQQYVQSATAKKKGKAK